jgi:hypothetical protein
MIATIGSGDPPGFHDSAFVTGSASYTDEITLLGTGSGFIRAFLDWNTYSVDSSAQGDFTLGPFTAPTFYQNELPDGVPVAEPIEFGAPIPISARLQGIGFGDPVDAALDSFWFTQSFEVLDASANKLTGYRYISASNGEYAFDGGIRVAVPEPGSALTLPVGLTMMALTRRR